jgi:hypothetical protein
MKQARLAVCIPMIFTFSLFAQTVAGPLALHTWEGPTIHVPPQEAPADLKIIYTNLGSKTDLYHDTGWYVGGPKTGLTQFIGMPFTPKSNSHVSQVQVAMQYSSGENQVELSIYNDAGGVPGALIAGPVTVTNLPDFGTCCLLAVASFTPVAVTPGTQYWVVASTPDKGAGNDFEGQWNWIAKVTTEWAIGNEASGVYEWSLRPNSALPAGEVLGTVP